MLQVEKNIDFFYNITFHLCLEDIFTKKCLLFCRFYCKHWVRFASFLL